MSGKRRFLFALEDEISSVHVSAVIRLICLCPYPSHEAKHLLCHICCHFVREDHVQEGCGKRGSSSMRNPVACTYHARLGLNVRIQYVCLCVCNVMYWVYPYVRFWRRHWLQRMWHGRRMKTLSACCATTVIA